MIAEAIKKVQELALAGDEIKTLKHGDQTFATRQLHRLPDEPPVESVVALKVATLSSLAAYLNENPDDFEEGTFISVVAPTRVDVITPVLGEAAVRRTYAIAEARLPAIRTDQWLDLETIGVHLRTCFEQTPERDEVVSFLGSVSSSADVQTKDDGVSQSTTVRSGLSMLKEGKVPSPVTLQPFRTFHDVEQPESPYILRLRKSERDGVQAALFEADGGAWQHDAAEAVAEFLRVSVPTMKVFA